MVRRLIVAAAVAVAAISANADWIYWNFKNPNGSYTANIGHSLYVFVSDVTDGDMKDYKDVSASGYKKAVSGLKYTVQSKGEALSKFSSILAGESTTADLGNLSSAGSGQSSYTSVWSSPYTAIGAASFTAFAIVFDAADIKDAQNYMLLEDYSVRQGKSPSITTTYESAETAISSAAGTTWKTIVWGDKADGARTKWLDIATIPEPTSGVMLLLGIAALALKRKRAA